MVARSGGVTKGWTQLSDFTYIHTEYLYVHFDKDFYLVYPRTQNIDAKLMVTSNTDVHNEMGNLKIFFL